MNPPEGIIELPNGQWVLTEDSHISRWAEEHGSIISDPHTMKFLDHTLSHCSVIWDIGAFIGDHTRHYLDLGKRVVAFEPNPLAFKCLEHNCPESDNHNIAASVANQVLKFTVAPNAGASRITDDGETEVGAMPLDGIEKIPDPDFVKLDVEGFELCALLGMRHMVERCHPSFYVEFNVGALAANHVTPEDLLDFFRSRGYRHFHRRPATAEWGDPQYDVLITR